MVIALSLRKNKCCFVQKVSCFVFSVLGEFCCPCTLCWTWASPMTCVQSKQRLLAIPVHDSQLFGVLHQIRLVFVVLKIVIRSLQATGSYRCRLYRRYSIYGFIQIQSFITIIVAMTTLFYSTKSKKWQLEITCCTCQNFPIWCSLW